MEAILGGMLKAIETIRLVDLPRFQQELLDKTSQLQVVPNDEARLPRRRL